MEDWDSVSQLYRIQQARTHTPYAQVADKMIDLINELQADERFHYVKVASAGMGMQLGIPGSKGGVYIEWHFPLKRFQIGVNLHEPSYKTEFEGVDDEEIVTKIYEKLQTLKVNPASEDPPTSTTDATN